LLAKKFFLMSQSPFTFFRGTDHLFWADFGKSGLLEPFGGGKDTRLWISADLHCDNFGSFTDAAGRLVYGLNDFDESVVADYQYDLWRLGVSLVLAGRENHSSSTGKLVEACALGYWRELKRCRWYSDLRHAPWDEEQASGRLRHFLSHTRKHSGLQPMLERWTQTGKGGPRFKIQGNPDLKVLPEQTARKLEKSLVRYAEGLKPWPVEKPRLFEILDLARRMNAGIGSEGLQRYYALVRVKAEGDDAILILDIKQQVEPSPWNYLPQKSRKKTGELCGGHQGLRVDLACRALSLHPDPWLGHLKLRGDDFLVCPRSPYKGALSNAMIDGDTAYQLGAILARAHCRVKESFAKKAFHLIREDKKAFRRQIAALSHAYADQVELDYKAFLKMKKEK
jgi:uncharacterized protein (DUF2252 family)